MGEMRSNRKKTGKERMNEQNDRTTTTVRLHPNDCAIVRLRVCVRVCMCPHQANDQNERVNKFGRLDRLFFGV